MEVFVEGTVESIGLRSTMVRRFDKAPVMVPNTKLAATAQFLSYDEPVNFLENLGDIFNKY